MTITDVPNPPLADVVRVAFHAPTQPEVYQNGKEDT